VSHELDALFAGFCTRWGLPAVSAARVSRETRGQATGYVDDDCMELAQAWPEPLHGAISQALFQRPFADSAILRGVLDRIERDLRLALADKFAPATAGAVDEAGCPGHAGLVCDVEWLQRRLRLRLSCSELRDKGWLTPAAPRPALARVYLERALAQARVPLVAQLGSVAVNVGDLLHLVPGDVLLLSESLDEPLRVTSAGSSLDMRALLGGSVPATASDAPRHRAMRCLPLQAS
jgi:hypothetical protein